MQIAAAFLFHKGRYDTYMRRCAYNQSSDAVLFIGIYLNNVSTREANERFVLFHAIVVVAEVIAVQSCLYNSCANRNPKHFAVQQIPERAA